MVTGREPSLGGGSGDEPMLGFGEWLAEVGRALGVENVMEVEISVRADEDLLKPGVIEGLMIQGWRFAIAAGSQGGMSYKETGWFIGLMPPDLPKDVEVVEMLGSFVAKVGDKKQVLQDVFLTEDQMKEAAARIRATSMRLKAGE